MIINLLARIYPFITIGAFGIFYASCPWGIFMLESYSAFFIFIKTSLISLNPALPLSSLFTNLSTSFFSIIQFLFLPFKLPKFLFHFFRNLFKNIFSTCSSFTIFSRFPNKFYSSAVVGIFEDTLVITFLGIIIIVSLILSTYIWFTDYDCGKYNKKKVVLFLLILSFFSFLLLLVVLYTGFYSEINPPLEEITIPDPKGSATADRIDEEGSTPIQKEEGGGDSSSGEVKSKVSRVPTIPFSQREVVKPGEKFYNFNNDKKRMSTFIEKNPFIPTTPTLSPEEIAAREERADIARNEAEARREGENARAVAAGRIRQQDIDTEAITHEMWFRGLDPVRKAEIEYELSGETNVEKMADLQKAHRTRTIAAMNLESVKARNGDVAKHQKIFDDADRDLKQQLYNFKVIQQQVRNFEINHQGFSNIKFRCICKEKPCSCLNKNK